MAPSYIVVVGSLNMDLVSVTDRVPGAGETLASHSFSTLPGGKGANAAVAAARVSHPKPRAESSTHGAAPHSESDVLVRMVGCVGDDHFGTPLLDAMARNQIDVSGVRTAPDTATGVSVIIVEAERGQNRILFNPGANYQLQPDDFLSLDSLTHDGQWPDLVVAQFEIRPKTVEQLLATAARAGVATLLNPAPASELPVEVYKTVTHLILNESEAAALTGRKEEELDGEEAWKEAVDFFLWRGVQNVVLTLGSKGAYYATRDKEEGREPAAEGIKVVDTTGAGCVSGFRFMQVYS